VFRALHIGVFADLVDWTTTKRVTVTLHHDEPGARETEEMIFELAAAQSRTWTLAYRDEASRIYSWSAQYVNADGTSKTVGVDAATEETLLLPATAD
jgi:hypothetical protein